MRRRLLLWSTLAVTLSFLVAPVLSGCSQKKEITQAQRDLKKSKLDK